jgi:hypothetical protein
MCLVLILFLASTFKEITNAVEMNSSSTLLIILVVVIAGQLIWWVWSNQRRNLTAVINEVEALEDGSYCISWGYINNTGKPIHLHHKESSLLVSNGAVLLLGNQPPYQFEKGKHNQVMKMVALENTEVEWIIKDKRTKLVVNTTSINKKGK